MPGGRDRYGLRGDGLSVAEDADLALRGGVACGWLADSADRCFAGKDRRDGSVRGGRYGDRCGRDVFKREAGKRRAVLVEDGGADGLRVVLIDDDVGRACGAAG